MSNPPRRLIILGSGGSAYDAMDVIEAINRASPTWEIAGFLDDARETGAEAMGLRVLGPLSEAGRFADHWFINAIGSDASFRSRPEIVGRTGLPEDRFATLVHPAAGVSTRCRIGHGVLINYGASIAGNVTIGDQVSVGPGCIVGHDAQIGAYSMLAPGAIVSGFVNVGRCVYVGAGATVRQKLSLGEGALIGMGAVVVKDISTKWTVVGNPARRLQV